MCGGEVLGALVVVGYQEHVWWWSIRNMCGGVVSGARVVVGY